MKTVLIVDDNIKNLDLFKDFVESWGYETVTAQQGKDAISLAERYLPDIILLDVMLPGMSGYEVCRELKENTKTQHKIFRIVHLRQPKDAASVNTEWMTASKNAAGLIVNFM